MVAEPRIAVSRETLASFCRKHHSKRLVFFGSVLRDDFGPDSDVDVLYEFEEGHILGFAFARIIDELSVLLGRPVDIVSYHFISPRIRERILAEAQVQLFADNEVCAYGQAATVGKLSSSTPRPR